MNDLNSNLDETDKIQDVFRQVDRDGDGEISFMEFFTKLPTIMGWVNLGHFYWFFYRWFQPQPENKFGLRRKPYGATRFRW